MTLELSQCTMQSAQVMSAGKLVATPHGVKPPKKGNGVARCTFAVFMQPDLFVPMAVPQSAYQIWELMFLLLF